MRFQEKDVRGLGNRLEQEKKIKMWIQLKSRLGLIPEGALEHE